MSNQLRAQETIGKFQVSLFLEEDGSAWFNVVFNKTEFSRYCYDNEENARADMKMIFSTIKDVVRCMNWEQNELSCK